MGPAALPRGPGQDRGDRADQPGVVVADHQGDAGQAAGGQAAQERQPPGPVLGAGHVDAEDLAAPVGVDTGSDQAVHVHRAAALADLLGQRVDPAERVRPAVQRPVPEAVHQLVQLAGHRQAQRSRLRSHPLPHPRTRPGRNRPGPGRLTHTALTDPVDQMARVRSLGDLALTGSREAGHAGVCNQRLRMFNLVRLR